MTPYNLVGGCFGGIYYHCHNEDGGGEDWTVRCWKI